MREEALPNSQIFPNYQIWERLPDKETSMPRLIIALAVAIVLGPILSYFSAWIAMGTDSSQEDTVGMIHRLGFPVWFLESAPGYSMVDGWHYTRLEINTIIWALAIFFLVILVQWRRRKTA